MEYSENEFSSGKSLSSIEIDEKTPLKIKSSKIEDDEDYVELIKQTREKKKKMRPYQRTIYENAKNKNSIIYLETGTGKTFISLMLSYYYLRKNDKKVIFLANTVQLVRQQHQQYYADIDMIKDQMEWQFEEFDENQLKKNMKVVVKEVYSHIADDEESRKKFFEESYKKTDILVLTPQIFLNWLRRAYIELSEFSLIIFDECHHTNEDHPYNQIMTEFYFEWKKKKRNCHLF